VIKPDLAATAYVNELSPTAQVRAQGPIKKGQPLYEKDILDVVSLDLGVDIPADCAVVLVRSLAWRKALFYDLGPLQTPPQSRDYDLSAALAQQTLTLIQAHFDEAGGTLTPSLPRVQVFNDGLTELRELLRNRCEIESTYQEFFRRHPWVFGGHYSAIESHRAFNDENIPDFTGVRHRDGYRDIFEIKQPFLKCFKADGSFNSSFNDSWNQAERYLRFARHNAEYLHREKDLKFQNPRCFLALGWEFKPRQQQAIYDKESMNPTIQVLTYEQILKSAEGFVELLAVAAGGAERSAG
jgi:hypothetical protein